MTATSRITRAFQQAAGENRAAFVAYLTAGYPNDEQFLEYASLILQHADMLEVGVPFSDPLGDGPTVQRAGEAVLAAGINVPKVFDLVRRLRATTDKPLVLMSYYNPIYCYQGGDSAFVADAKAAGADGVILPDLPPEEGAVLIEAARKAQFDTVFLVAPTSTPERLATVGQASTGFVYAVSVTGVTGARSQLPAEVGPMVQQTRQASGLPVGVGFGVASGQTAAQVAKIADGVIVGSALIDAITRGSGLPELLKELEEGVRTARTG